MREDLCTKIRRAQLFELAGCGGILVGLAVTLPVAKEKLMQVLPEVSKHKAA